MQISLKILPLVLTDGSTVFNVFMNADGATFRFSAVSNKDALAFVDKLSRAIDQHTTDVVKL